MPRVLGGMGTAILSTSSGVMTSRSARGARHRRRGHLFRLVKPAMSMSRIGRSPIELPAGVSVSISPGRVMVNGPLGELAQDVPQRMAIEQDEARSPSRGRPTAARTARCTG